MVSPTLSCRIRGDVAFELGKIQKNDEYPSRHGRKDCTQYFSPGFYPPDTPPFFLEPFYGFSCSVRLCGQVNQNSRKEKIDNGSSAYINETCS